MNAIPLDPGQLLQSAGVERTPLRELVVRNLAQAGEPLQPLELLERVRAEHAINKVSLYRILDMLTDLGVTQRIASPNPPDRAFRYCLSALHGPRHCHLYCLRCKRMTCLAPDDEPALREAYDALYRAAAGHGVRVEAMDIRMDGVCETCAARPASTA